VTGTKFGIIDVIHVVVCQIDAVWH
jgi:hypothetical protein